MSTHLFQALVLGLLLVIVVVLLVAISMLGKVRAALESGRDGAAAPAGGGAEPGTVEEAQPTPFEPEAGSQPVVVEQQEPEPAQEVALGADAGRGEADETSEEPPAEASVDQETGSDSQRPYEEGGRWYFRRAGELLVYEEGTGEWVPAGSSPSPVHAHAEAVAASSEPPVADSEAATQVEHETQADPEGRLEPDAQTRPAPQPSTSFGGQPITPVEDVALDEPVLDAPEPAPATSDSFWKCPACGAVNGSTAATCRMCFTPRP